MVLHLVTSVAWHLSIIAYPSLCYLWLSIVKKANLLLLPIYITCDLNVFVLFEGTKLYFANVIICKDLLLHIWNYFWILSQQLTWWAVILRPSILCISIWKCMHHQHSSLQSFYILQIWSKSLDRQSHKSNLTVRQTFKIISLQNNTSFSFPVCLIQSIIYNVESGLGLRLIYKGGGQDWYWIWVGLGLRFDLRFGLGLGIVGIRVRKVTDGLGLGLGHVVVIFPVRLGFGFR